MIKVYIASPYTQGDVAVNVKTQLDYHDKLMSHGFTPFAPLLTHFVHMAHPRKYKDWLKHDLEWLKVCDVMLRLPGESHGADIEEEYCKNNNIPVFTNLFDLLDWHRREGYVK